MARGTDIFIIIYMLTTCVKSQTNNPQTNSSATTEWTTSATTESFTRRTVTDTETVVHLLDSPAYDKFVRPNEKDDIPITVYLDLFIARLSSFNEASMEYDATLYFRQTWVDDRLINHARKKQIVLSYNAFSKLWVPDTFLANEDSARLHTVTVPNRLITLDPDGTIFYSQKITVTLACEFMLQKFPHDNQTCGIYIESFGYNTENIIYEWKDVEEVVQLPEKFTLPEYSYKGYSLHDCSRAYVTGNFSCKYINLHLDREIGYYVIRVFVPSILIVGLSWVSFWIDYRSVPARISLGLLTVLTITTQASSVTSRLPPVSYVKAIDVWMSVCLVFVFCGLIEYSIVNVLARSQRLQGGNKEKKEGVIDDEDDVKCCAGSWSPRSNTSKAKLVDRWSRVVFPASFAIFNIFYWSIYYGINIQASPGLSV